MNSDIENFKKIPRNDVLIYLHQNNHINYETRVVDLYDRINKPTYVFCFIIDDLVRLKLIKCDNYISLKERGSFFPERLSTSKIIITERGNDYVQNKLFGFNPNKYDENDSLNIIKYYNLFSGFIDSLFMKPFSFFQEKAKANYNLDAKLLYFLCTGKNYKSQKDTKIFISYSWDSEEHKVWVKNLAEDLREFNVEFDEYLKQGMSPNNYMKANILSSDFVIIIFTPNYLKKIEVLGSGVNTEFSLIQEELFRKISGGKYLAILREGDANHSIPEIMRDTLYFNFVNKDSYNTELCKLIELLNSENQN